MTYYIKNGDSFVATDEANLDIHKELPALTYTIREDDRGNLFLSIIDSFSIEGKVYGDHLSNANRIVNTFDSRGINTGVLLTGEKGSGKTLLAKQISMSCQAKGYPTIVINRAWIGDKFNQLIQSIDQPAVVVFDEFEKTYDREQQPYILTLLDGVFPSKKLFIFTVNDRWGVDSHMHNRPGRIFYAIEYNGLSVDFVRDYCLDRLEDQTQVEKVCRVSQIFAKFNFDMLKALVEEMNRYKESPQEALRILNARPESDSGQSTYEYVLKDSRFPDLVTGGTVINTRQSLISQGHCITYWENASDKKKYQNDEDDDLYRDAIFTPSDIISINADGTHIYKNAEGQILSLTKQKAKEVSYLDLI